MRGVFLFAVSLVVGAASLVAEPGGSRPKKQVSHAAAAKAQTLTPLSERERVVQTLDRFGYGARPGEVDRVLAGGGPGKWLETQLNPSAIPDGYLQRKLADYPTLGMTPAEVLTTFPDNRPVQQIATGKRALPTDPLEKGVYETLVWKWHQRYEPVAPGAPPRPVLTDEQMAAEKAEAKAVAARVAGQLLALPREQRMAALMALPVEDCAAFASDNNLPDEQRRVLLADFTPREREAFFAMGGNVSSAGRTRDELAQARMVRDVLTNRQLEQVMTNFWFNHFNVYMPKDADSWYTTAYERDVIRPHALGKFKDLLLATAESPAMMVYLDNWLSLGPDSLANGVNPANPRSKRGNRGLNENYGREVMELHTVGVNGGYTQGDVTALSAILTGWGVDAPYDAGAFKFDARRHEPGPKFWFGYRIDEDGTVTKLTGPMPKQSFGPSPTVATDGSVKQGIAALEILASSPQTAHFISWKLAQYFVADKPPAALVDRLTGVYLSSDGDIKALLRAIAESPEFNSREYFHNKVKTPEEFLASAFRATETAPDNAAAMVNTVRDMGEPLYQKIEPTGYYLTAEQWMNSKALIDRLNFAYLLTSGRYAGMKFDAPRLVAEGLMSPGSGAELGAALPVGQKAAKAKGPRRLIGWSGAEAPEAGVAVSAGEQLTVRVLEEQVVGAPLSAETGRLIGAQMAGQPANASAVERLNLLTALVLGSPEFQSR